MASSRLETHVPTMAQELVGQSRESAGEVLTRTKKVCLRDPREREAQRFRIFLRASVEIDTDSLANSDKSRSFWSAVQTRQHSIADRIHVQT